jgi:hypothetical protein
MCETLAVDETDRLGAKQRASFPRVMRMAKQNRSRISIKFSRAIASGGSQMNSIARAAIFLILPAIAAIAQDSSPTVYVESFRQSSTQIIEDKFDAKLNPANPTYRERIKDAAGNDRYELTITPQGPAGDNKITSWRAQLRDLRHSIYSNLLVANQEPSPDPQNNLWWLDPNRFGSVPIRARRIIKVDGFYVLIQVKDLHFTPLDSPYLDSMAVRFEFTNTDPRNAAR